MIIFLFSLIDDRITFGLNLLKFNGLIGFWVNGYVWLVAMVKVSSSESSHRVVGDRRCVRSRMGNF